MGFDQLSPTYENNDLRTNDTHTIHTPRLSLRPFRAEDVPSLYSIQSDSDAMRYTHVVASLEDCSRWLQAYEDLRPRLGFAPWVVVDRSDSSTIGWGGLNIDPFDPGWGVEVTYFFHRTTWGRGFATELVRMSIHHAFKALSLPQVGAFAMPDNVSSIRVLEKCGFAFVRYEPRLARNYYQIERSC